MAQISEEICYSADFSPKNKNDAVNKQDEQKIN